MKIFIRREGGQLPTYSPQGTIETDDLSPEEAQLVMRAFQPEKLRKVSEQGSYVPEGFTYFIRVQGEDGFIEELQAQEKQLDSDLLNVLHLLMTRIQQSMRNR